jgi:hypothetical protein
MSTLIRAAAIAAVTSVLAIGAPVAAASAQTTAIGPASIVPGAIIGHGVDYPWGHGGGDHWGRGGGGNWGRGGGDHWGRGGGDHWGRGGGDHWGHGGGDHPRGFFPPR